MKRKINMKIKINDLIKTMVVFCILSLHTTSLLPNLQTACERGRLKVVKRILKKDKKLALKKDGEGKTPLHYAALGGKLNIAKLLVEKYNVPIETYDKNNQTPISLATQKFNKTNQKKYKDIQKFLQKTLDEKLKNLKIACERGRLKVVRRILRENPKLAAAKDSKGRTPLHYAALGGQLEIAKFLVTRYNAQIVIIDYNNKIPSDLARQKFNETNQKKYADLLNFLEKKSIESIETKKEELISICKTGNLKDFKEKIERLSKQADSLPYSRIKKKLMLLNLIENPNYIKTAYKNKNFEIVKYIIKKKIVNNIEKNNILYKACKDDNKEIANLIIKEKIINVPLLEACEDGQLQTCKYLIEKLRFNPNDKYSKSKYTREEETPLYNACYNHHLDIAKYLIVKHGVNVNTKVGNQTTPLEGVFLTSGKKNNLENKRNLVALLLENGAKVEKKYIDLAHDAKNAKIKSMLQAAYKYQQCKTKKDKMAYIQKTKGDIKNLLIRIAFGDLNNLRINSKIDDLNKLMKSSKAVPVDAAVFLDLYKNPRVYLRLALHVKKQKDFKTYVQKVLTQRKNNFRQKQKLAEKLTELQQKILQNQKKKAFSDIEIKFKN